MSSQLLRPGEAPPIIQESLNKLEGLWKVIHHGSLITPIRSERTPRLTVYFRKLACQRISPEEFEFGTIGSPVAVHVPAAELMRLPLNVVIQDSRIALDPNLAAPGEQYAELKLDLSEPKVSLVQRYEKDPNSDDFVIRVVDGRTIPSTDVKGSSYYVAIEYDGDPHGVIIPCAEVFRFFYCTSSRLANTILSDRILDPDRYIIDHSRSGIFEENERKTVVWLRQWMFNSDRRHIARLFFTPGAFEEAKRIFLRASGHENIQYKHSLIAYPPFHGPMEIKAFYKTYESGGKQRIFITRIRSTDWSLPFETIHYGRDNDSERVATEDEREDLPEDERLQRPKVLINGSPIRNLANTPTDDSSCPIELDDFEFADRFPNLARIYSPKILKKNQKTKNNKGQRLLPVAGGSLVEGSARHEKKIASAILQSARERSQLHTHESSDKSSSNSLQLEEKGNIAQLINLFEKAIRDYHGKLKIRYRKALDITDTFKGAVINYLPRSINGIEYDWYFWDKEERKHTKCVLITELIFYGRVRYAFEFQWQRGKEKQTSILVFWNEREAPIEDGVLALVVTACMQNKRINLSGGSLLSDFYAGPVRHPSSKNSTDEKEGKGNKEAKKREEETEKKRKENEARYQIKRIFEAKNKMTEWRSKDYCTDEDSNET